MRSHSPCVEQRVIPHHGNGLIGKILGGNRGHRRRSNDRKRLDKHVGQVLGKLLVLEALESWKPGRELCYILSQVPRHDGGDRRRRLDMR